MANNRRKKILRVVAILIALPVLGLLGFLFLTPLGREARAIYQEQNRAPRKFDSKGCMENLKSIGQALNMYLSSNEAYPPADQWTNEISNVLPVGNDVETADREKLLRCPDALTLDKDAYGYAMNNTLSAKAASALPDPKTTVFVFDSPLLTRNANVPFLESALPDPPRHGDSNNLLYADGSAKAMPKTK